MVKLSALVFGAATLMLGAGAAAQDATTLRQRAESARNPPFLAPPGGVGTAALGMRGTTGTEPALPTQLDQAAQMGPPAPPRLLRLAARRAAARRYRQITAQPVHGPFRAETFSPNTLRDVQPIFGPDLGLPPPRRPRKRPAETDPYAPVGYRVGSVSLFPSIEQGVGYDSNPNRSSGDKKASVLLRTEGELRVQSDWSRHELTGLLRGAYNDYPSNHSADRPDGSGRLNLRLDASRDTQINLETRYFVDTQRPGSPELNASVRERPLVASVGASAGVTERFNHLSLGLRGSIDRTGYEDARLTSGTILDQSDRDRTQYETRLRAGYELKPGLVPFVEGILDTRVYDRRFDFSGFQRSSDGIGGRAGSTFEFSRLLTGEASAGYMVRSYEDRRLKDLQGPLLDGALIWSATPLTTVRLRAGTQIAETSIGGSSGALASQATLEVQHDLRRNISLIGAFTVSQSDYRGIDLREDGYAASVKLDYRLTRSVALRASFTHERLKSTDPSNDYTANVYLVGLRFQP